MKKFLIFCASFIMTLFIFGSTALAEETHIT